MAKGILFDLSAIARRSDGDPAPLLKEMRDLGHEVYAPEFRAAHAFVLHLDVPRRGYEGAEQMLEAVFRHLELKPKRTEIMSLAPVFAELHRVELYEDAQRALPKLAKAHRVGVVSALPPGFVKSVLGKVGVPMTVVTPAEAKSAPPNPKAFRAALAAMKLKAKDVALASASCEDLAVGAPLGLTPVYVRRAKGECADAAFAIASLEEFEAVLASNRPEATEKVPAAASPISSSTK